MDGKCGGGDEAGIPARSDARAAGQAVRRALEIELEQKCIKCTLIITLVM
jgi:hypothetical protein